MADDNKGGGIGSNSTIIVALLASSVFWFARQTPLQTSRPGPIESRVEAKFADQDVDARLWQDPLEAIAKAVKSEHAQDECATPERRRRATHCRSPLLYEYPQRIDLDETTAVFGIVVPGAPYFESVEARRRLRYAVVAALQTEKFNPVDAQHIGYFRPKDYDRVGLPEAVPYELFRNGDRETILVLWVDEDILTGAGARGGGALKRLAALRETICPAHLCKVTKAGKNSPLRFSLLGPDSSDAASNILNAKENGCAKPVLGRKIPALDFPVSVYSYSASLALHDPLKICLLDTKDKLIRVNLDFFKGIASDKSVRDTLEQELKRRGVGQDHVALLSDRDTQFGQNLTRAWQKSDASQARQEDQTKIIETTYLRGLDGMIPAKRDDDKKKDEKEYKSRENSDVASMEEPFGQSQFDYIRRQARELKEMDEKLRREQSAKLNCALPTEWQEPFSFGESLKKIVGCLAPVRGIEAIGVLGNDVFDKLLLLQALRPLFPEALFFTTDFDQTLATPRELLWSRNLIIGSTYGATTPIQQKMGIAPFRSGYHTSAFLSMRLAIAERGGVPANDQRDEIREAIRKPKIFEIDRYGQFIDLPTGDWPPTRTNTIDAAQPIYPQLSLNAQRGAGGLFALLGAALALSWRNKIWPKAVNATLIALLVVVVASSALAFNWDRFGEWATQRGLGEPIFLANGASIWPSVGMRAVGALLSMAMVWDVWRTLKLNLREEVHQGLGLEEMEGRKPCGKSSGLRRLLDGITYDLPEKEKNAQCLHMSEVLYQYKRKSQFFLAITRISLWMGAILSLYFGICYLSGSYPNHPWRHPPEINASEFAPSNLWLMTTFAFVFALIVLVFIVVDATILCLKFVTRLRDNNTEWPLAVKRKFVEALKINDPLLDEWIDLQFIAKRTRCISMLIYLPFAAFAILIVSRSTLFAAFAPHPSIYITQAVCFVLLFGCALALCFRAKQAQEAAKEKLLRGMMSVQGRTNDVEKTAQLSRLLVLVETLHEGSFVPLSEQPPIRALLLPLGSIGWTTLLEYRLIPGL